MSWCICQVKSGCFLFDCGLGISLNHNGMIGSSHWTVGWVLFTCIWKTWDDIALHSLFVVHAYIESVLELIIFGSSMSVLVTTLLFICISVLVSKLTWPKPCKQISKLRIIFASMFVPKYEYDCFEWDCLKKLFRVTQVLEFGITASCELYEPSYKYNWTSSKDLVSAPVLM